MLLIVSRMWTKTKIQKSTTFFDWMLKNLRHALCVCYI